MADEENLNLDNNDEQDAAPKKSGGGIGGLLPFILKWVAIVLGAMIFIVTVVFVTMAIINKNTTKRTASMPMNDEVRVVKDVLSYYSLDMITTRTSDKPSCQVMVKVQLGYKQDDKITSTEITQRKIELIDFLRRYFTERYAKELVPSNEDTLKKDIKDRINDEILNTSKIKEVMFEQFNVIEP